MKNYYIMSMDTFTDTFTLLDSARTFTFSMEMSGRMNDLMSVSKGDIIMVYRKSPDSRIHMYMEVLESGWYGLTVRKRLEVAEGVPKEAAGLPDEAEWEFLTEIDEKKFREIRRLMLAEFGEPEETEMEESNEIEERVTGAGNVLLYGVPGVGKSYEIREKYCDDPARMERVVFHPEYTYSDFAGQILPKVEEESLKYVFTPGPFTRMLEKAWKNPGKEYFLVIEELNRGNAPSVFGEIFQLLDRKTEDNPLYHPSEYGESEYAISNSDIAAAVYGKENHEVRIPSNLWILATMNTADQNIFTMDTAFQRRWAPRHMRNDILAAEHAWELIEGTGITWGAFAQEVNEKIADYNMDMASSEDKRMGAYFVKKSELSTDHFPQKVLKYLWDDAFKLEKGIIFGEHFKSLEDVLEAFETAEADKLEAVLNPDVYQGMQRRQMSDR